jgi:anti-sigma B factor antagonist
VRVDIEREGDVVVVIVEGELDASTAPGLRDKFEELIGQGDNKYVIDLGGVGFMDSSGISAIVNLFKRVRIGQGDVKLCCLGSEIMRIFELTRLNRVFDLYESRAAAISGYEEEK